MADDGTTRRRFLEALGASGASMLLAGCGKPNQPDVKQDPNSYDYQFVEGKELAVNLPKYRGEPVRTQTTVAFNGDYLSMDKKKNSLRLYEADPDDTVQTFPVGEQLDGPVYNELGDTIHTDDHDDILLQLYGRPQEISDWVENGDSGGMTYHEPVFIIDDAERPGTETSDAPSNATNTTNSTAYEG